MGGNQSVRHAHARQHFEAASIPSDDNIEYAGAMLGHASTLPVSTSTQSYRARLLHRAHSVLVPVTPVSLRQRFRQRLDRNNSIIANSFNLTPSTPYTCETLPANWTGSRREERTETASSRQRDRIHRRERLQSADSRTRPTRITGVGAILLAALSPWTVSICAPSLHRTARPATSVGANWDPNEERARDSGERTAATRTDPSKQRRCRPAPTSRRPSFQGVLAGTNTRRHGHVGQVQGPMMSVNNAVTPSSP